MGLYNDILQEIKDTFATRSLQASDIRTVQKIIHHNNVTQLLEEISTHHNLLERIALRSYTHALGFDKMVLMDISKDIDATLPKVQLRFHIWHPANAALPIVESLHEHSFDFISMIMKGGLENQMFLKRPLQLEECRILEQLQTFIAKASLSDIQTLNTYIEALEIVGLQELGSMQKSPHDRDTIIALIHQLTGWRAQDIVLLPLLEGSFVSNRVAGERAAYKHILKEYVALSPYSALRLQEGDYYFHPYQMPHRLYYNAQDLNATMLITTPVTSHPEGGSLQRPSYVQKTEQCYNKIPMTVKILQEKIISYLKA